MKVTPILPLQFSIYFGFPETNTAVVVSKKWHTSLTTPSIELNKKKQSMSYLNAKLFAISICPNVQNY